MSATGTFKDVIKHDREQTEALPVDAFPAELDEFIRAHSPYRQNRVIPAIGEGHYATTLYHGLDAHYGVKVKNLEVHAYAEAEHGDKALELMQRVCITADVQRRVRRAVRHTILTNEWRTFALNRWLDA